MKLSRNDARMKRKRRIRKKISGTSERPRLVVFRSNKYIYAQIVDDEKQETKAASSSLSLAKDRSLTSETARLVGQDIARKAKQHGVESVVFDRNGYVYTGRVKALADSAREEGLKF
jgi:large subunit ribosomal protein L18